MTFVGSTPFFPPGFVGRAFVESLSVTQARDYVRGLLDAGAEVVSFCGHAASAEYLGVPLSRVEAPIPDQTQVWIGIRPTRRPAPGEELSPQQTPEAFVGWRMVVTPATRKESV